MLKSAGRAPVFASFTLAFSLQLRKKHGKTSVGVRKTSVRLRNTSVKVQYTYYQNTPTHYKTLKKLTHYKIHIHTCTHTHTLQNNIKPPEYKSKRNAYRRSNIMGRKDST